jgi:hypothetical protein
MAPHQPPACVLPTPLSVVRHRGPPPQDDGMPDYSFPLLKAREIQEIFAELGIPVVEDDLINPAGWKVKQIYEELIGLLLQQRREDMALPSFTAGEQLEYPELHEESVPTMSFLKAWCASHPRGRRSAPHRMPSSRLMHRRRARACPIGCTRPHCVHGNDRRLFLSPAATSC